eukprot:TRINITY_DN1753_c1_g1_i2.p1 TRINITY_DN1753_c1_g1~~TRINITY_DN1753_c1_g1_i2.p1  ORF type:complete len:302 (-),score=43.80 TRINITY_DN1753_c1_g1_i2:175-1080(-)
MFARIGAFELIVLLLCVGRTRAVPACSHSACATGAAMSVGCLDDCVNLVMREALWAGISTTKCYTAKTWDATCVQLATNGTCGQCTCSGGVQVGCPTPPVNDECPGAIELPTPTGIGGTAYFVVNNYNATISQTVPFAQCIFTFIRDVWFSTQTIYAGSTVSLTTCSADTQVNTGLAIYYGCNATTWSTYPCNNDAVGGCPGGTCATASTIAPFVAPYTGSYKIRIGANWPPVSTACGTHMGTIGLTVTVSCTPKTCEQQGLSCVEATDTCGTPISCHCPTTGPQTSSTGNIAVLCATLCR